MADKPKVRKNSSAVARKIALTPKEEREKSDRAVVTAIDKALLAMQKKLSDPELKPTINDFIKLLQMKKDLEGERPKDVTVRWVEECSEIPSNEE